MSDVAKIIGRPMMLTMWSMSDDGTEYESGVVPTTPYTPYIADDLAAWLLADVACNADHVERFMALPQSVIDWVLGDDDE